MAVISQYQVVIPGQIITADLWNGMELNIINSGLIPSGIEDYSATDAQMRTAVDPYPAAATSRPTSLQGEVERLRYQVHGIINGLRSDGTTYWYEDGPTSGILNVDNTNSRVGINETSPDRDLHVSGMVKIETEEASPLAIVNEGSDTAGVKESYFVNSAGNAATGFRQTATGFDLAIDAYNAGWSELIRVGRTTGDVGIGETSPGAKLDVNGDLILQNGAAVNEFSTDGTLAGDSDLAVPTEKAVKTYVDAGHGANTTKLRYKKTSDTAINSGVEAQVQFDEKTFDTLSEFDGFLFTATTSGYYMINGRVWWNTSGGYKYLYIRHNGSDDLMIDHRNAGFSSAVSALLYLSASDTIDFVAQQLSGSSMNIRGSAVGSITYSCIDIHRVL